MQCYKILAFLNKKGEFLIPLKHKKGGKLNGVVRCFFCNWLTVSISGA